MGWILLKISDRLESFRIPLESILTGFNNFNLIDDLGNFLSDGRLILSPFQFSPINICIFKIALKYIDLAISSQNGRNRKKIINLAYDWPFLWKTTQNHQNRTFLMQNHKPTFRFRSKSCKNSQIGPKIFKVHAERTVLISFEFW